MTFKTILLVLNETRRNAALVEQAATIASLADGHIKGLYVLPAVQIYPSTAFEAMPAVFEAQREYFESQREAVKTLFHETLARHGARGEMQVVDSSSPLIADAVVEHGRCADLVILSQVDSEGPDGVELDFADRVIMACGRPVLMLPLKARPTGLAGTVIVGWNGSREAARAAFDGLPLLRQAREVRIVWVDPQRDLEGAGSLAGSELAEALARHGVNAIADPTPGNGQDAGEALLTKVRDTGAGFLVTGAYGHTRLREFILGGVTRLALQKMTCPVLFSH